MKSRQERIESLLRKDFSPQYLEVFNESDQHSGPGFETHFRVRLISSFFESRSLVERHRLVYKSLQAELDAGLHALSLEVFSTNEEAKFQKSPPCAHKN
jgi:BolA protein